MSRQIAAPVTAKDAHCRRARRMCRSLRHASHTSGALRSHLLLASLLMLGAPLYAASSGHTITPTGVITTLATPAVHAACGGVPLPPGLQPPQPPPTPNHYRYREFQQPYQMSQFAYLLVEGGGISGSYAFDGFITVNGNGLHVSAMGQTAVQKMGSVTFFMTATLLQNGIEIMSAPLTLDEVSDWPRDSTPVGTVTFTLPEPTSLQGLTLQLTGRYAYHNSNGNATPIPPSTNKDFTIGVIEQ